MKCSRATSRPTGGRRDDSGVIEAVSLGSALPLASHGWSPLLAPIFLSSIFLSISSVALAAPRASLVDLQCYPPAINLFSAKARQRVVVEAIYSDGVTRDVTSDARLKLSDPKLARMDHGLLFPLADGKADLRVSFQGRTLTVPITVTNATTQPAVSFKRDVMPIFMKAGCNAGACHGTSRGKDGFHLSLFGYDPDGDYFRLTREQIGRRINLAIPEESLIVQKGLGAVQHTGGVRFATNSELHKTLLAWLAAGAPKDGPEVAKVSGIEIFPKSAVMEGSNSVQRFIVRASYSDGTERDVTPLAVFLSNNDVTAKVGEEGLVASGQRGEAFIQARFAEFNVGAQIIVLPKNLPDVWGSVVSQQNGHSVAVPETERRGPLTPTLSPSEGERESTGPHEQRLHPLPLRGGEGRGEGADSQKLVGDSRTGRLKPGLQRTSEIAARNYIDEAVFNKLRKLRLLPSDVCDDATFIRRAFLDLTGTLPTPEETLKFTQDTGGDKRNRLVEQLLGRKEFNDLWVMKWAELLQIRTRDNRVYPKAALVYFEWLRDQMQADVPLDRIVHGLLTASGSTLRDPPANYYQIEPDTLKIAENTAQVFLGMRIQCAQCHNHPFDRWTLNDYYSFAAFFSQVGRKQGDDPRETIIFDRHDGESKHPVTGAVMRPKFLGGEAPEITGESRREALARWLTSPENPYFARNIANIVWSHFLGRGIVEPVDDMRLSNPPCNPELLDALAAKLIAYNYDFKKLVRDICASRTYQLSTRPNQTNGSDERNFSKAALRRIRAEVLLDCISQVTDTQDKFAGLPLGARAVQIADGNTANYFLTTFGRATRSTVCSCEVKTDPNLSQALHLLNGSTVENKIEQGGVVKKLLKEGRTPPQIIENLYLRCLSRKPTPEELANLDGFLKDNANPEQVLSDIFWSLLNAKEFVFNH